MPGDALRFELWDDNVMTDDTAIYSCPPMLATPLADQVLECAVYSGALLN
jgi:hypothetical protein